MAREGLTPRWLVEDMKGAKLAKESFLIKWPGAPAQKQGPLCGPFDHTQQLVAMGRKYAQVAFKLAQERSCHVCIGLVLVHVCDDRTLPLDAQHRFANRAFSLMKQWQQLVPHDQTYL
jgi:hypothetical protein